MTERSRDVPEEYWSQFVSYRGASEVQYICGTMVPRTARRVLIIGVFGGRDYFYFKVRGHEVHAAELAEVPGFDNLRVANVEESLPYPDGYFDAVVLSEVLEHLVDDGRALGHIRRVLSDEGVLVVAVPFLHEAEPTHIRVHTRVSVERLLRHCGFDVVDVCERPGAGFYVPGVNVFNHAVSIVAFLTAGKTIYDWTLPVLARFESWAGRRRNPLRRLSPSWGAHFRCKKLFAAPDRIAQNQAAFCAQATARHDRMEGKP
jgi:SAM-dependent methyltransferase